VTLYNGGGAVAGSAGGSSGHSADPGGSGVADGAAVASVGKATPRTSGTAVSANTNTAPQSDPQLAATGLHGGDLASGTLSAAAVLNNLGLPAAGSGLFHTAPASSGYLVETNPAFTNHNTWLSSDWMLNQLGIDPARTQKRLGDGFYEQRLVRDQVLALTGQSQLRGYKTEQDAFQALLAAGVATARAFGITPGISLSAAQIASLTTDVVMLEERTVDGQRVLVSGCGTIAVPRW
jgi:filamentous hemagglutinin